MRGALHALLIFLLAQAPAWAAPSARLLPDAALGATPGPKLVVLVAGTDSAAKPR